MRRFFVTNSCPVLCRRESNAVSEATASVLREQLELAAATAAESATRRKVHSAAAQQSASALTAALMEQQCLEEALEEERRGREAAERRQEEVQQQVGRESVSIGAELHATTMLCSSNPSPVPVVGACVAGAHRALAG